MPEVETRFVQLLSGSANHSKFTSHDSIPCISLSNLLLSSSASPPNDIRIKRPHASQDSSKSSLQTVIKFRLVPVRENKNLFFFFRAEQPGNCRRDSGSVLPAMFWRTDTWSASSALEANESPVDEAVVPWCCVCGCEAR
jgi:hypothetical protein